MIARTFLLLLLTTLYCEGLWAQSDPLEKLVGIWRQTVPDPGPPPQSRIHKWELLDKNRMQHFSERVDANGKKSVTESIDIYGGQEHPDGNGTVVIFRRIDSNTIQQIRSKDGKIVRFLERVISPDGRTLTIRQVRGDSEGKFVSQLGVYKKQ